MVTNSFPNREGWSTEDVMVCGSDYSLDDAAIVMMGFWNEYANKIEARLIGLVDQTETMEIREDDCTVLIRKFSKYPARPVLQAGFCLLTQGDLLDRAWHQWAEHVEEIFSNLRDCLSRGERLPKEHQTVFYTIDDKAPGVQNLCMAMDPSPTHISQLLRALLYLGGVESGASRIQSDELLDGIERLCLESGTYSGSGSRAEELAIRVKNMKL